MVFFDNYDFYKIIYIHVYNVNKQDSPLQFVSSTTPPYAKNVWITVSQASGTRWTNHGLTLDVLCGSRIDLLRTEMKRGLNVIRSLLLFEC